MRSLKKGMLSLASVALLFGAAGCKNLDVTNPNNPDVKRVLSSPADVVSLAGSSLTTWFNTMEGMDAGGPMTTMADSYTASWNNYYMRIYSSEPRSQWINNPAANERVAMEWYWYNYYSMLSSANDVVKVTSDSTLHWDAENLQKALALGRFLQGISLAELALNYDKAFYVDETFDLGDPSVINGLHFIGRAQLRDSALKHLDMAIAVLDTSDFETDAAWTGKGGDSYTSGQLAQIANTEAARLIAYYPRTAAELGQVSPADWGKAAAYASNGLSKVGSEFDFIFTADGNCPDVNGVEGVCDALKVWGEDPTSMRVDTRVAHMLDPNTQAHPWPGSANPQPHSADKRLGNGTVVYTSAAGAHRLNALSPADSQVVGPGTFRDSIPGDTTGHNVTVAAGDTAYIHFLSAPGTDFAYFKDAIFNPSRGSYHQTNISHIRYVTLSFTDPRGTLGDEGPSPVMTATENDLLWAEALIRGGGSLAVAADKINNTRVDRGGLPPVSAASGVGVIATAPGVVGTGLLGALQYEQDIELIGITVTPYYNRRKIDGLQPLTPHEMPVPAKELGVLRQELYTFGGTNPLNSTPGASTMVASSVRNVHQIARSMRHHAQGSRHF